MSDLIDITLLKPHPRNKEVYGDEDVIELVEQIKKSNWIKPIVVKADNTIISGHRRYYSCLKLGINQVPCEVEVFSSETAELERLLRENQSREKTEFQKMKEAEMWEEIEKEKAKDRMKQGTKINPSEKILKGRTSDIVAARVGIGSGKTYDKAKKVVKAIDDLKSAGNTKNAEFVKTVLNENISGAKKLIDNNLLDSISEEIKDKVINKEVTVQKAIREIKNDLNTTAKEQEKDSQQEQSKEQIQSNSEAEGVKADDSIIEAFETDAGRFIGDMGKYIKMEEVFEDMTEEDKGKVMAIIKKMEDSMNKIKTSLA